MTSTPNAFLASKTRKTTFDEDWRRNSDAKVDLSDASLQRAFSTWGPEVEAAIRQREAKEALHGIASTNRDSYEGPVWRNGKLHEEFLKIVYNLPTGKCMLLLNAWSDSCEDKTAMPSCLAEMQMRSTLGMPDLRIVIERFWDIRDDGDLRKIFNDSDNVLDTTIGILIGESSSSRDIQWE